MKRTTMATAVLAAILAVPALAAEDFRWQGRVAQGGAVEIKGVNGGITATGTSGGPVEVTAVKRGKRSDPAEVKVEVVEHAGGVTICAVYPSGHGSANLCAPGEGGRMSVHDNDVAVEFQVKVPAGVRFVGKTVNGSIAANGIAADAEVSTVNGRVEVDAAGVTRANTVNGGLTARLGRADWKGTLRLATVNGTIDVALPQDASVEVTASTVNGQIETEFPLTVTGRVSHRRLHGTIGSGGRTLELQTVNGGIRLRKNAVEG